MFTTLPIASAPVTDRTPELAELAAEDSWTDAERTAWLAWLDSAAKRDEAAPPEEPADYAEFTGLAS
jgi:hypothetical protein